MRSLEGRGLPPGLARLEIGTWMSARGIMAVATLGI